MGLDVMLNELIHKDCSECHREEVVPTGAFVVDHHGAYIEVHCKVCGTKSFVGDGEFWDTHEIVKI